MPDIRHIALDPEAVGDRLDRVLARLVTDVSRARLQAVIKAGGVSDGVKAWLDPSSKLTCATTSLTLTMPDAVEPQPRGEVIALDIIFEDDSLIVINKPAGLVVHPAAGHATGTLVNALIAHCGESLSGIGGVKRPGIVHRLDKDTTGLMVVAKTDRAHKLLSDQFADHGRTGPLERAYLALCWGMPDRPVLTIEAALDRHPHNREKMAVVREDKGRHAITHVTRLAVFGPKLAPVASLVRCELETGRTHQIRVHMTHIGHPLLGDASYGTGFRTKIAHLPEAAARALQALNRQALHAAVLGFAHPVSGETLHFERAPPADFQRLHEALRDTAG
jgi:23S rRNA pseudouridine1911/1915/1917 synthase